jgi:hypothetical protein
VVADVSDWDWLLEQDPVLREVDTARRRADECTDPDHDHTVLRTIGGGVHVICHGGGGHERGGSVYRGAHLHRGQVAGQARGGQGMTGKAGKPHYTGNYTRRARLLRQAANANPDTRCWRCGRTLPEHPPHRSGHPPRWQAGHVVDSQVNGALAPEASTCNASAGASYGNRLREPRSEDPYT